MSRPPSPPPLPPPPEPEYPPPSLPPLPPPLPPPPEPEYPPPSLPPLPPPLPPPPEPEYPPPSLPPLPPPLPPPPEPEYPPPLPPPPEPEYPPPSLPPLPPPLPPPPEPEYPPPSLPPLPPPLPPPPEPEYPPPLSPPPPPPPPPPRLSPRIQKVYPVIREFKKKIDHDPKDILKTWTGKDVCKYKGFFCADYPDDKERTLAGVDFNGFLFGGKDGLPLSGFIDQLPDITVFHANSNNFTGGVPKNISKLKYFFELDLSNNKLSGQFPMEVLGATKLTFLDLRFNSLCGTVPPQVFNLDVDVIFINNNNFEQKLPDNLGSTPSLYLTFANNRFTGPIPRSIGTGKTSENLIEVLFLNNKLTGCLPYEIGRLKLATVFDVSMNQLTGTIPYSFQCLAKIELLNLARNHFYGSVPEAICKLPNLAKFALSYNYFTEVGPKCRNLIRKKVLDLRMNCIIDLPDQRSKADCKAFFSKAMYHTCPNEKSLIYIPCKEYQSGSDCRPTFAATSPLSYNALTPHKP